MPKVKHASVSLRKGNTEVFSGKEKLGTLLSRDYRAMVVDTELGLDYLGSNPGFTMSFSFLMCKIKLMRVIYFIT